MTSKKKKSEEKKGKTKSTAMTWDSNDAKSNRIADLPTSCHVHATVDPV